MGTGVFVGFHMGCILIKICPQSGMDDQFAERIGIENFQKPRPFFRRFPSDPGLDRKLQMKMFKTAADFKEKPVQRVGIREKSGTFAPGHHGTGGTAKVQIDLPVSITCKGSG